MAMTNNRPAAAMIVRRRVERVPACGEKEVAIAVGLDPARNLAQECADYYLLAHLRMPHYLPQAAERLEKLAGEVAGEFTIYLDLACGGELRYASTWPYERGRTGLRGRHPCIAWSTRCKRSKRRHGRAGTTEVNPGR